MEANQHKIPASLQHCLCVLHSRGRGIGAELLWEEGVPREVVLRWEEAKEQEALLIPARKTRRIWTLNWEAIRYRNEKGELQDCGLSLAELLRVLSRGPGEQGMSAIVEERAGRSRERMRTQKSTIIRV